LALPKSLVFSAGEVSEHPKVENPPPEWPHRPPQVPRCLAGTDDVTKGDKLVLKYITK